MAELYRSQYSPHLAYRQRSHNCVLAKEEVGRARPSCYNLPGEGHVYGWSGEPAAGSTGHGQGVQQAMTWTDHVPSPARARGVDFQRLNRAAAGQHVTSPRQLAQFRAEQEFVQLPPRRRTSPGPLPSEASPGHTYGRRGRPATPVADVIAHQFGQETEAAIEERYRHYDEERAKQGKPFKIKFTKAAGSRRRPPLAEPEDPMKLWKMSKFSKAPAQVLSGRASPSPSGKRASPGQRPGSSAGRELARASELEADRQEEGEVPTESEEETETEDEAQYDPEEGAATRGAGGDSKAGFWPPLEQTLGPADVYQVPAASETRPATTTTRRVETLVVLHLTVRHEAQEELEAIMRAVVGGLRGSFSDSVLKVRDIALEEVRQGGREGQQRYLTWGPEALRTRHAPPGAAARPSVLSPVLLSLAVLHRTPEELQQVVRAVVEHVGAASREGAVQVRQVRPSVTMAAGASSAATCLAAQGQDEALRYPLRPRMRPGRGRGLPGAAAAE